MAPGSWPEEEEFAFTSCRKGTLTNSLWASGWITLPTAIQVKAHTLFAGNYRQLSAKLSHIYALPICIAYENEHRFRSFNRPCCILLNRIVKYKILLGSTAWCRAQRREAEFSLVFKWYIKNKCELNCKSVGFTRFKVRKPDSFAGGKRHDLQNRFKFKYT